MSPCPEFELLWCRSHSLYDYFKCLSQRNGLVVEEVEVQLVAEEGGSLQ